MMLTTSQIEKLTKVREEINIIGSLNYGVKNIDVDLIEMLKSVPLQIIYDEVSKKKMKIHGYLLLKGGSICPLFYNQTYVLRSISNANGILTISENTVGYVFDYGEHNKHLKIKDCIREYNKKVKIAISQYPKMKKRFDSKFIVGFKTL